MLKKYTLFSWLWGTVILLLTLLPGKSFPQFSFASLFSFDKLIHLSIFLLFAWLLIKAFTNESKSPAVRSNAKSLGILIAIGLGAAVEVIQHFIPDRSFELADMIANSAGCFISLLFVKAK